MTLMKQKEPKEPKRRIALIMNVLFYFCGLCIGGGIVRNLTLCYELGKDDTANFIWHILPESVTMLVMTICGFSDLGALVYFSHSPQCEERGSVCLSEFIFDTNHWGADSIEWAFSGNSLLVYSRRSTD